MPSRIWMATTLGRAPRRSAQSLARCRPRPEPNYTVAATDCGTTILFTSSSAITLTTLNSLPAGCSIAVEQGGSGQVTIVAGSGATQHSAHSFTKTYGQYAILGLFVDTNIGGVAADVIITGDGA